MSETIERVAKAIARDIGTDPMSRWNPGHGENFPQNYTDNEQKVIRAIAAKAVEAVRTPAPDAVREALTIAKNRIAYLTSISGHVRHCARSEEIIAQIDAALSPDPKAQKEARKITEVPPEELNQIATEAFGEAARRSKEGEG